MVELLCRRLSDRYSITLVCDGEGELPGAAESVGVEVHSLPLATKGAFARHIPALGRLVRRLDPDLVHLFGQFAGSLGQLALQLAGRPPSIYNVQWPSYLSDRGPLTAARNWVAEKVSCALATVVVPTSESDARELCRRRLCDARRLEVISNSYLSSAVAGAAPPFHEPDRPRLAFVGRLVDQKGWRHLVEAMPGIVRALPGARLTIVGDGPDREEVRALVARLGVESQVELLGYVRDPAPALAAADAVVVPSIYEPFGIVALEGMVQGRPVIASRVGGLAEVVVDGETGRLVPPGSSGAIVRAVEELARDPSLARRWGDSGRRRAEASFGPDACAARFGALYDRILAAGHR